LKKGYNSDKNILYIKMKWKNRLEFLQKELLLNHLSKER